MFRARNCSGMTFENCTSVSSAGRQMFDLENVSDSKAINCEQLTPEAYVIRELRLRRPDASALTDADLSEVIRLAMMEVSPADPSCAGLRAKLHDGGSLASLFALASQILGSMS